jgi:hypothetical protein
VTRSFLNGISDTAHRLDKSTKPTVLSLPKRTQVSTSHENNKVLALGLGAVVGLRVVYFKR